MVEGLFRKILLPTNQKLSYFVILGGGEGKRKANFEKKKKN